MSTNTPLAKLVLMTAGDFETYLASAIESYAQENVRAGHWREHEALEKATAQFAQLLPAGVQSPKQHLFSIVDATGGATIGMIWLAERGEGAERSGFIYDFNIDAPMRGRGFGRSALQAVEDVALAMALPAISLHVFAHNKSAFELYQRSGYETKSIFMTKPLRAA